jgi:hypothetical protein
MYGRIYTVRVAPTAVSAALDFLELVPATDKPVIIHKVVISPTVSETNQQVQVTIRTLPATLTSGSGGSTPVAYTRNTHDAASAFTVEAFNTGRATTSGTAQYHADEGFPSQGGYEYLPDIYERPVIYAGQGFIVGIEESLGGAVVAGYAVVEEL